MGTDRTVGVLWTGTDRTVDVLWMGTNRTVGVLWMGTDRTVGVLWTCYLLWGHGTQVNTCCISLALGSVVFTFVFTKL